MSILSKENLSAAIRDVSQIELPIGKILINDHIGEGGTSIVKKCQIEDCGKELAIKFLAEDLSNKPSTQYKRFKQSFLNIFLLQDKLPVVPQLYFGHLNVDNFIIPYTIMPYIPTTLKSYRKKIGDNFKLKQFDVIFKLLLDGIEKFHEHKIVHRDLKPENIFIQEKKILIGDCDIAMFNNPEHIQLVSTKTGERLANYAFSAPEQFDRKIGDINDSSDWFAFGQIMYWLITLTTVKGQNPPSILSIDSCWIKYNDLINKLTTQKQTSRLNNKEEIERFLLKNDMYYNSLSRETEIYKSHELFNEILRKNFPGRQGLFKTNNVNSIWSLFKDLNEVIKETELYCRFFNYSLGDYCVDSLEQSKNKNDEMFWLINNKYELYIENLWIYKADAGFDFIVIEIKPMQTNEIFGQITEDNYWVAAGFDNGNYMSSAEYYDGYSIKYGKLTDNAVLRERYVKKDLLILSPQFSSMYNAVEEGSIERLFTKYKNNNYKLEEDYFKELMNTSRYIQHLMPSF